MTHAGKLCTLSGEAPRGGGYVMKIRELLIALEVEGNKAAEELGERWRATRGAKLMEAIQDAKNTLYGNVCKCGELKGSHSGEQAMGGCEKSGCGRYKPVEL
jgi:hypothetical protein